MPRRRNLPGMNMPVFIPEDHKSNGNARKGRVSAKIRHAVTLKVVNGLTGEEAARAAGVSPAGLWKALSQPHVKELAAQLQQEAIERATARKAFLKLKALDIAEKLLDKEDNPAIQARMVEFLGAEPRANVAVQVNNHPPAPASAGYTYARPDTKSEAGSGQVIDGKAKDVTPE